jgi:uncharacterized membrane protein
LNKPLISKLFVGGLSAVIAGVFLAAFAFVAAIAASAIVVSGAPPNTVDITPFGWSMILLGILAALAIVIGSLAGLVAWIGALINTAQLDDKTWFIVLLVLGLLSFGLVAMIAYVIAGPDGAVVARRPPIYQPGTAQ